MNGRGKRNKGAAGERELAGILADQLGRVVKRNLGQARDGADDITIEHFRLEVIEQFSAIPAAEPAKKVNALKGEAARREERIEKFAEAIKKIKTQK